MHIKKLHEDNWREWRTIRLRCLKNDPDLFGRSYEDEESQPEENIRKYFHDGFIVGAFDDNNLLKGIAGTIINKGDRRQHKAIVWGVYVDPECRERGVFKNLMRGLIENLPPFVEQLLLDVSVNNKIAIDAYKKIGFSIFGTEPRARKIGSAYHDEHMMILFLK
jgi:ribosomal protein S18 acetylase RimI-like enzyme